MLRQSKYIGFFVAFAAIILTSCEDVIVLDLDTAEQQTVIEANLDAELGDLEVRLTKTGDFYQTNDFEGVSDAVIALNVSNGDSYVLIEGDEGVYTTSNINIQPNETADLSITLATGELYTATAVCPTPTYLDSLEVQASEAPFSEDIFYQLLYNFQDPEGVDNYYRTKVYENNRLINTYVLFDDEAQDGEYIRIPFFGPPFDELDTLDVTLMVTDEAYHEYYLEVNDILGQGLNASVPYNPQGNFDQDVLGYFGIYYTSTLRIIAEE